MSCDPFCTLALSVPAQSRLIWDHGQAVLSFTSGARPLFIRTLVRIKAGGEDGEPATRPSYATLRGAGAAA